MGDRSIPDILILSNGPGEVTTWVRPVVQSLRSQLGNGVRISVVLSPCANASGREADIVRRYAVDRVQGAEHFFPFLLWGKTHESWEWSDRGVVIFLGGDQLFPVIVGKRLGYATLVYGEWETRWHGWVDRFGVMNSAVGDRVPLPHRHKVTVVGDLMAEAGQQESFSSANTQSIEGAVSDLIGLLPGSKPAKLAQGVPLCLAVAEQIYADRPQTRFVLPIAPTLDVATLASFADAQKNPIAALFNFAGATLSDDQTSLTTTTGVTIDLCRTVPAYDELARCQLCLTTIGANTAELAALGIPMIVLLPTQQLDAMRAWDGLPGLLANLPGVGTWIAKGINAWFLRTPRLLAWPNIWAKEMIVPELVGLLQPEAIAALTLDYLTHPEKLAAMRQALTAVRGETGAADRLAHLAQDLLNAQTHTPDLP